LTVAAVAYEKLTPSAKKKAAALLKLNPAYPDWVANASDQDRDEVAFVTAATWPDAIKKRGAGFVDDGENPSTAGAAKNVGYTDNLQHRYWHYIDVPFSPDGTPLKQPSAPNARTQISAFRAMLAPAPCGRCPAPRHIGTITDSATVDRLPDPVSKHQRDRLKRMSLRSSVCARIEGCT
jgi:hypothetical protein